MSTKHHDPEVESLKQEIHHLREDISFLKQLLITTRDEFRRIKGGR